MMKKITVLTAGILCAAGIVVGASAAGIIQKVQSEIRPDFTVKIDGEVCTFKNANGEVVYPMLYDGTTYLPVRAIGELMGKTVYWYEDDKLIELKDEKTTVTDADVIVTDGNSTSDKPKSAVGTSGGSGSGSSNIAPSAGKGGKNSLPEGVEGITIDEAKKIALDKAGAAESEVVFKEAKYDFDDGRWVCDIEFVKDKIEYSAEILVSDGTVVSWEIDRD